MLKATRIFTLTSSRKVNADWYDAYADETIEHERFKQSDSIVMGKTADSGTAGSSGTLQDKASQSLRSADRIALGVRHWHWHLADHESRRTSDMMS